MKIEECLDLKPCPFCGNKAYLLNMEDRDGYDVKCNCRARIVDCGSRDLAIEAWNRRS